MTALESREIVVLPFTDNGEFLEAKFAEVMLQLECTALRRQLHRRGLKRWMSDERTEDPPALPAEQLERHLNVAERGLLQHRAISEARLEVSDAAVIPFLELVQRCKLTVFDQQALWLLFFKAVSPEFREHYSFLEIHGRGTEGDEELRIGNLLELLTYTSVSATIRMRERFSVDAPLMVHHLVRMDSYSQERPSILDADIHLPQRIIGFLSGDASRYLSDSPCLVERPTEQIGQVILDNGLLDRVLNMVDHHTQFAERCNKWGISGGISYGQALTILEYGSPGTGKTLLARALAHRTGKPLVSLMPKTSAEDTDVEYLFREARLQDGIVFIDECESICSLQSGELHVLLRELEQFDGIAILATNRPQDLVPQLDRRFTLKLPFALPSEISREQIWAMHLGQMPLAEDVDLSRLARDFPMPGGYIKNATLTAVNEILGRNTNPELCHADLVAACQLQRQHVGGQIKGVYTDHPKTDTPGVLIPATLDEQLTTLARGLRRQSDVLDRWGLDSADCLQGARVLFHGEDWVTMRAAIDRLAVLVGRQVSRVGLDTLINPTSLGSDDEPRSPEQLIDAATHAGQILLVTDFRGDLSDPAGERVVPLLELLSQSIEGILIFACRSGHVPVGRYRGLFHETLKVTVAGTEVRCRQWNARLGGQASHVNTEALAREFALGPGQMSMVLEMAVLRAGETGEAELTTDLLRACAREVAGKDRGEGLFG